MVDINISRSSDQIEVSRAVALLDRESYRLEIGICDTVVLTTCTYMYPLLLTPVLTLDSANGHHSHKVATAGSFTSDI